MDYTQLLFSQITDIFRIGLIVGLILTMERTRAQTGFLVPLVAGLVFVAFIIPVTMPKPELPMMPAIAMGIVANAIIFAVLWSAFSMFRKKA